MSLLSSFLLTSPFILVICSTTLVAAISAFAPVPSSLLILLNQLVIFLISFYYGRQILFSKVITRETRHNSQRPLRTRRIKNSSLSDLQGSLKTAIPFAIGYLFPVYVFYQIHWFGGLIMMLASTCLIPYLLFIMLHHQNVQYQLETQKVITFLNAYRGRLILLNATLYFSCLLITDFAFIHGTRSLALIIGSAVVTLSLVILFYQHASFYLNLIREIDPSTAAPPKDKNLERQSRQGSLSSAPANNHPQLSTEIELALKTGQYDHAVSLLEHALEQTPHSILRRQQLYLLLSELNDLKKLSRHAEVFLSWMLDRGKIREASQFLYRLRKHDPTFVLHNLTLMAELARQFTRQKKYALVLWLAESCQKHALPGEDLAAIFLCASQVLVTHYQDLSKAEEYLLFIIKHCNACESAAAAKALLIHLQNNQSREQQLRE